jgi:hypothetical protein
MTTKKVNYICVSCGSDRVLSDSWAIWNPATQQMELESTFDNFHCVECDGECNTKEIPYEGEIDNEPSYKEVLQMLEELHNKNVEDQESGFEEGIYDAPENEGNNNVAKFIARAKGE